MTTKAQLQKAHWHNQQIIELVSGNEWEKHLMDSLSSTRVELERQINNLPEEKDIEYLYRIEEEKTSGWDIVDDQLVRGVPQYEKLTKSVCNERLNALISEGYNPERLRIRRDV
tara:strand:- start:1931 stop:2272 length:342 start_codon:yes stop_codon:yes gene_type:complete